MASAHDGDAAEYADRAEATAVAGISEALNPTAGRFLGQETWRDQHGHWLRVRVELGTMPGVEIRYARVVLAASGPDLEPEMEGMIFSSGLEERLNTRMQRVEPVDGVVTL